MKQGKRLTGLARIIGLLVAIALLLGLLLPLAGAAAQEASDTSETTVALSEVPSTGASRPGPVIPASARVRVQKPAGFVPVELQVDKIGLDAPVEAGQITDGVMQDPSGPWVVAWYSQLGKVGQGGNVVMAGHVDYWDVGPAIFQGVPSLVPGDVIRVLGEDGQTVEYAVQWARLFDVASELTPEVIQKDVVGDDGNESITLITCGGEFNGSEYLQRFIVRADKI